MYRYTERRGLYYAEWNDAGMTACTERSERDDDPRLSLAKIANQYIPVYTSIQISSYIKQGRSPLSIHRSIDRDLDDRDMLGIC